VEVTEKEERKRENILAIILLKKISILFIFADEISLRKPCHNFFSYEIMGIVEK